VRFGYSTEKIKEIQKIVGTEVDGLYGEKTLNAVKKHQKHLSEPGLYEGPANGLWDAATEASSVAKGDMPSELEQLRQILADLDQEERIYMIHLKYHTEQTNIFHNALGYRKRVHMAAEALLEIGSLMLTISTLATLAQGFMAVKVAIVEAKKGLVAWEVVKGGAKIAAKKAARGTIWHEFKTHARETALATAMEYLAIRLKGVREEGEKDEDAYLLYHYLRHNAMRRFVVDIIRDIDKERKEVLTKIAPLQQEEAEER